MERIRWRPDAFYGGSAEQKYRRGTPLRNHENLPWNTQDLNVNTNGNGKVLLEQLKTFDLDWAFLLTYWNFNPDEIQDDFSKYVGEKIGLESNYLIEVEKIEENTEKAMAITGGEEFYICTFHTLEGGDLALYLFPTRTTPVSTYLNDKNNTYYVEGWANWS